MTSAQAQPSAPRLAFRRESRLFLWPHYTRRFSTISTCRAAGPNGHSETASSNENGLQSPPYARSPAFPHSPCPGRGYHAQSALSFHICPTQWQSSSTSGGSNHHLSRPAQRASQNSCFYLASDWVIMSFYILPVPRAPQEHHAPSRPSRRQTRLHPTCRSIPFLWLKGRSVP